MADARSPSLAWAVPIRPKALQTRQQLKRRRNEYVLGNKLVICTQLAAFLNGLVASSNALLIVALLEIDGWTLAMEQMIELTSQIGQVGDILGVSRPGSLVVADSFLKLARLVCSVTCSLGFVGSLLRRRIGVSRRRFRSGLRYRLRRLRLGGFGR